MQLLVEDENVSIREAALNSIGLIDLTDLMEFQTILIKVVKDRDPSIRALAAWALGKLENKATVRTVQVLIFIFAGVKNWNQTVKGLNLGSVNLNQTVQGLKT